ncbi:hypothetical protein Ciccas_000947 [Cichlidogyrus casuarinus]|uniref:Apical junction molecule ajm1 alpha/beta domain-containing protein n=1 Tax=Cichlidogyrus casuarinus TaxID=1844966 RepID=A0ABD2QLJ9_9PLAT
MKSSRFHNPYLQSDGFSSSYDQPSPYVNGPGEWIDLNTEQNGLISDERKKRTNFLRAFFPDGTALNIQTDLRPIHRVDYKLDDDVEFQIYHGAITVDDVTHTTPFIPYSQPIMRRSTNPANFKPPSIPPFRMQHAQVELVSGPIKAINIGGSSLERNFVSDEESDSSLDEIQNPRKSLSKASDSAWVHPLPRTRQGICPPSLRSNRQAFSSMYQRHHAPAPNIASRSRSMNRSIENYQRRTNYQDQMQGRASSNSRYRVTDLDTAFAESRENIRQEYLQQVPDSKSCNSLLETDIDVGNTTEKRYNNTTNVPSMASQVPTARNFTDKAQSLFNLNTSGPDIAKFKVASGPRPKDWQRTSSVHILGAANQSTAPGTIGGLVSKLRDKASSEHELRVAQSLTRLEIPDWLNKADMPEPYVLCNELIKRRETGEVDFDDLRSPTSQRGKLPRYSSYRNSTPSITKENPDLVTPLFRHSDRYSSVNRSVPASTSDSKVNVQMVSQPNWTITIPDGSTIPRFVRPSQQYRMREMSTPKLEPIKSKLKHSMRSLSVGMGNDRIPQESSSFLAPNERPILGPKSVVHVEALGTPIRLEPDDFVPKENRFWADHEQRYRYEKSKKLPETDMSTKMVVPAGNGETENAGDSIFAQPVMVELIKNSRMDKSMYLQRKGSVESPAEKPEYAPKREKPDGQSRPTTLEDLKTIDQENSYSNDSQSLKKTRPMINDKFAQLFKTKAVRLNQEVLTRNMSNDFPESPDRPSKDVQKYPKPGNLIEKKPLQAKTTERQKSITDYERGSFQHESVKLEESVNCVEENASTLSSSCSSKIPQTEASDGLSNLKHLGGFTDLLDQTLNRYLVLHKTASVPTKSDFPKRLLENFGLMLADNVNSLEKISQSMLTADFEHDVHKQSFLALLSSPMSMQPLNLSDFSLSHLTGCIERKKEDGRLYLNCASKTCSTGPRRSDDNSIEWKSCCNCFTIYCSSQCRKIDFECGNHQAFCNYARAKRLCGKLIPGSLNPGQIEVLAELARLGYDKLGRGAVVISFASSIEAERFLRYTDGVNSNGNLSSTSPKKVEYLLTVPTFLTLNELLTLDDIFVEPCKAYNPNFNFILVVFVCAFEMKVTEDDMLPVHLLKHCRIVNVPNYMLDEQPKPSAILRKKTSMKNKSPKFNKQERDVFWKKLENDLAELGVRSLNDINSEAYKTVMQFLDNGQEFDEIRIELKNEEETVFLAIRPMEKLSVRRSRRGTEEPDFVRPHNPQMNIKFNETEI